MLSVIVTTFDSAKFIKPCLDSIFNQGYGDLQVIVVDNGSKDGTCDFIKVNYSKARLITNKNNLGACHAKNQGIEIASGEWILTLDCDVVLEDGFIGEIMEFANNSKDSIGMIQPKILTQGKKEIYSCGIGLSWLSRFHDIGRGFTDTQRFDVSLPVFGACCAAALYRRKMLEEVKDSHGYFDRRFFFLFEDADLSWRAQKRGWLCMYYPKPRCFHRGNSSSTDKKNRQILSFGNRQLAIFKNQNPILILLMFPLYLVYDLPRFLMLAVKFKCKFPKFSGYNPR
ncbi:MAG: glycosyltransferase family 2 protein [Candidatus Omnitrophica bacterium]|nr:glycosyltransferase family 2 protein [Candidatus Omnitrophota bacterium]